MKLLDNDRSLPQNYAMLFLEKRLLHLHTTTHTHHTFTHSPTQTHAIIENHANAI